MAVGKAAARAVGEKVLELLLQGADLYFCKDGGPQSAFAFCSMNADFAAVPLFLAAGGDENPYLIGRELGEEMTAACTVVKEGARLEQARGTLASLRERYAHIALSDTGLWTNQNLSYAPLAAAARITAPPTPPPAAPSRTWYRSVWDC